MTVHEDVTRKEWEPELRAPERRLWLPRLVRRLLAAGVALAMLAAVAVGTFPTWYRPMAQGSFSGLSGGVDIPVDGEHNMVIGYADRSYAYGLLSLRNNGRLDLRIERIGTRRDQFEHALVEIDPERTLLPPPNVYGAEGTPFQSFTLHPGEERAIAVALWMDHCENNGANMFITYTSVPVRYRILGMARHQDVDLGDGWTVRGPNETGCPRPRTTL